MKQHLNICHLYLGIIVLSMLNGVVFTSGSFIMRVIQMVFVLMSLYYTVLAFVTYQLSSYFKALAVLVFMFTIYGVVMIMNGKQYYMDYRLVSKTNYLLVIYMSLLPIFAFYVFARKGLLTERTMKFFFFVFLSLAVANFIANREKMLLAAIERGSDAEEFTNNVGYTFVGLLPALVLFYKKPFIQYICLAVCAYFIILGMKRGAMLAGGICLLWFLANNVKRVQRKRRWLVIVVSIAVVIAGAFYVRYMMENSAFFQARIAQTQKGDSSGRDELYSGFLQHFIQEDNPFRFLFGNGANSTLLLMGQYAHNDWLALAVDQGLMGIIIYLVYWVCLYKTWRKSKLHPQAFMNIGMFLIIYFLTTLFSMSYSGVSRCAAMVFGYYLAVMEEHSVMKDHQALEYP